MEQQSERVSSVSPQSNVSAGIQSSRMRGSIYRVISRLFVGHFQDGILCFGGPEGEGIHGGDQIAGENSAGKT